MKVLILTDNYPRKTATTHGIFIHRQVKALQQLGAECHVLLLHNWYPPFGLHTKHAYWRDGHDKHATFFTEYEGVKIHAVPMFVRMPGRIFKETHYDRATRAVAKFIKNNPALNDADWLYAHFITESAYIAARVKDQVNIKLAAIARGDDIHAWPHENPALVKHFPVVFEKADLLLANSTNLGRDMQQWMTPPASRDVATVYNGIDTDLFQPAGSPAVVAGIRKKFGLDVDTRYLLCVAAPVALEGWLELLEAIKELGSDFNGWKLVMVAPVHKHRDGLDLVTIGKELGVSDKLHYIPGLPAADLAELYKGVDAFTLPSYDEGMANAMLEAMATELPCIVTEVGGHNEVINNGVEGLLIQPKSVSEIVKGIKWVVQHPEERRVMGQMARKSTLRLGNFLHNGKRLIELFKSY